MKFSHTINETRNNANEKGFAKHVVRLDLSVSGDDVGDIVVRMRDFLKEITKETLSNDEASNG